MKISGIRISEGLDAAIDSVAARARSASQFLGRSWFETADSSAIVTLIAESAGEPVIALPLVLAHRILKAVPGCYWPFRSFPVAENAALEDMKALLGAPAARRAMGFAWRVGPIYADDPALVLLRSAARTSGWILAERRIATSFLLDLTQPDWPRNSTLRKNRFHEKHLAGHGALDWRFVRGRDWSAEVFADLAAIEAKSWHSDSSDPKFLPGPHRAFWERLASDPAQAGRMSAAILYISGEPAAFSFDLDCGEVKYAIANSYDPAFAKHSPGKCLYYRNLAEAQKRGVALVDWGAGDGGYKQTIGAGPGPEIVDCLMIRAGLFAPIARLIAHFWKKSGRHPETVTRPD